MKSLLSLTQRVKRKSRSLPVGVVEQEVRQISAKGRRKDARTASNVTEKG